ncbi:actin cytoskeleton-regulatory complex protein pan1-like [Salvia divinorum]|uniref:Actin cytoskeleton-regulatory complex protein pan1-like n=1 Tax=Salvia divinorum TaxID=28513 RepID=A0ABD1G993_SALDI
MRHCLPPQVILLLCMVLHLGDHRPVFNNPKGLTMHELYLLLAKVPELEKHLLDQLSTEEQNALNKKFEEAKDDEEKVAELEKDILEAKQKVQFYHAKMQELVLYKSRCDNRLNEISEKVVGDKREAELLSKKYEEKCMQVGDVASKLTIEEATFRDIQVTVMVGSPLLYIKCIGNCMVLILFRRQMILF